MSHDLLAAFGAEDPIQPKAEAQKPQHTQQDTDIFHFGHTPLSGNDNSSQSATTAAYQEDDDFGDFEDASQESAQQPVRQPVPMSKPEPTAPTIPRMEQKSNLPFNKPTFTSMEDSSAGRPKSNLPFKPKPVSMEDSSPGRSRSNLPFKPKPATKEENPTPIGRHPFADQMDFLFSAGDDEYDAGQDELTDLSSNPEAAMAYSKRIIAAQMEEEERRKAAPKPPPKPVATPVIESRQPKKLQKKSGYMPTKDPNVLFDVENPSESDGGDDDDWGDFEAGNLPNQNLPNQSLPDQSTPNQSLPNQNLPNQNLPRHRSSVSHVVTKTAPVLPIHRSSVSSVVTKFAPAAPLPLMDLLGLDDEPAPPTPPKDNPVNTGFISSATRSQPNRQPPPSALQITEPEDHDSWADFDMAAPPTQQPAYHDTDSLTSTLPTSTTNMTTKPPSSPSLLPPTNIPPPAILLSIFPSLITSAQDSLLDTLPKLPSEEKSQLPAHPAAQQFLQGYLGITAVLAHIIAGRKQRWKRDQHLAQSMRIGPSAAGGSKGGMKLAGVDKAETAKEDREVLDAVRLWRAQAGKLRSAVAGANAMMQAGKPKLSSVPEIAEQMPVRTLKVTEGGITAPYACALCGLKREERVVKVDTDVEDSFGEWWVQGMNMHATCVNWWKEHEHKLRGR